MQVARTAGVMLVAWCAGARADGLVIAGGSPRAIGRAGVGTVGDDGGGALLVNPAAMARRDTWRVQVGVAFIDDAVDWVHAADAPRATDQAGSTALPLVAAEAGFGDWVIGAGAMTTTASDRALRRPGSIPPDLYENAFEYRYVGLSGSLRRDTITIGAARRFGEAVAIGLSVAGSRVAVSEARRIWAGDVNRVVLGIGKPDDPAHDPAHDVELAMSAADGFSPSAVAGLLVAPPDTRVELGASIGWARAAHASGDLTAAGATPPDGQPPSITVQTSAPTAQVVVRQPLTLRTGARWLGEHWIAEVGGDLWIFSDAAASTSWDVTGLRVIDTTPPAPTNAGVDLRSVPSRISARTHGALRCAIDVELIAGFLWATAGYAYSTGGTAQARLSPTFGDLGGHTAALGLEINAGGFTATLGWARTWSIKQPESTSAWRLDNPFATGDAMVPPGTYDGSTDLVGLSIDAELGGAPP